MDIFGGIGNFLGGAANAVGNFFGPAQGQQSPSNWNNLISGAQDFLAPKAYANTGLDYTAPGTLPSNTPQATPPPPPPVLPPTTLNQPVPAPVLSAPALQTTQQGLATSAQEQIDAQTGLTQSQINELALAYDALASKLGIAKADAGNVYKTGSQDVANRYQEAVDIYGNAAKTAQTRGEQLGADAQQRYQDIQLLNRNIARSQGALSSSYYGNLQNQAGLNYSREAGDIGANLNNQLGLLESQKAAVAREAANNQQKLADEWQRNVANITIDQTLTEKEKAAKINTARAELENRIATIQDGLAKFNASLGTTQAQIDAQLQTARTYASGAGGFGGGYKQEGAGLTPEQVSQLALSHGYIAPDALRKSIDETKNSFYNTPLLGPILKFAGV